MKSKRLLGIAHYTSNIVKPHILFLHTVRHCQYHPYWYCSFNIEETGVFSGKNSSFNAVVLKDWLIEPV